MIDFDYVDHLAYFFNSIEDGYRFFSNHDGFQILYGPGINESQNTRFIFVRVNAIGTIGIFSPIDTAITCPLNRQLDLIGPGFNHICYAVTSIDESISFLREIEWKILQNPVSDDCFCGRRAALLFHQNFGLVRLLESRCSLDTYSVGFEYESVSHITESETNSRADGHSSISSGGTPSKIVELINASLEDVIISENINSFDEIHEWDSLSQAIFHSLFETCVKKHLAISEFTRLEQYVDFYNNL